MTTGRERNGNGAPKIQREKLPDTSMKPLFRIFELSKSEQRVVLIAMFVLITVVFVKYEHRLHSAHLRPPALPEARTTPSPVQTEEAQ
jgi:hypothetical protein